MIETYYKQKLYTEKIPVELNVIQSYKKNAEKSLISIKRECKSKSLSLFRIPGETSDILAIESVAERYCDNLDNVVVLGTGGSILGSRAICAAVRPAQYSGPRMHFVDNIDPETFETLFHDLKPKRTGFIVISKSGRTMETITQFLHCLNIFRAQTDGLKSALDIT